MNRILLVGSLIFIATLVQAQDEFAIASNSQTRLSSYSTPSTFAAPPLSPVFRKDAPSLMRSTFRIPGEREKRIGSTLTTLGGAMLVGGIIVYAQADKTVRTVYNAQGQAVQEISGKVVLGAVMILVGTGMTVPGILLWRKGIRVNEKYLREQESLSLNFNGASGSIRYRF